MALPTQVQHQSVCYSKGVCASPHSHTNLPTSSSSLLLHLLDHSVWHSRLLVWLVPWTLPGPLQQRLLPLHVLLLALLCPRLVLSCRHHWRPWHLWYHWHGPQYVPLIDWIAAPVPRACPLPCFCLTWQWCDVCDAVVASPPSLSAVLKWRTPTSSKGGAVFFTAITWVLWFLVCVLSGIFLFRVRRAITHISHALTHSHPLSELPLRNPVPQGVQVQGPGSLSARQARPRGWRHAGCRACRQV